MELQKYADKSSLFKSILLNSRAIKISAHSELPSSKIFFWFFVYLGLFFIVLPFLFNTPAELFEGAHKIILSPARLLTDYMALANIGAAFFNAGLMLLISILLIKKSKAVITGSMTAAIFTVVGFSFFGKNLYNSLLITLGVYLFAKLKKVPFSRYISQSLYGSALAPLVSEITFNMGLPLWQGILMGSAAGITIGLLITPLSIRFIGFHQGYNLYNTGFAAGIIGMFFTAVLRAAGIEVEPVNILSSGHNYIFALILYLLFSAMFVLGLFYNCWSLKNYRIISSLNGRYGLDLVKSAGIGPVFVNMSLLGLISTSYVLVLRGELNGPTIGAILTVVGFGAAGKHPKNVLPIIIGVLISKLANIYDPSSTVAIITALFGTTLAPIAGTYGPFCGIIAGALHMVVSMNLTYLHGGINLYNNGFAGGFIAAVLVPIFDIFYSLKNRR